MKILPEIEIGGISDENKTMGTSRSLDICRRAEGSSRPCVSLRDVRRQDVERQSVFDRRRGRATSTEAGPKHGPQPGKDH